jgi:hypothetical protein
MSSLGVIFGAETDERLFMTASNLSGQRLKLELFVPSVRWTTLRTNESKIWAGKGLLGRRCTIFFAWRPSVYAQTLRIDRDVG